MIWLFGVLLVNRPLKDILTGRNPGHEDSGNFHQKVLVLTLFLSHWWAWYSISPLWLLHLCSLCDKPVTRSLNSKILLDLSASRQLYAIFITAVQLSKAVAYVHIFYHFFYNSNSECFCFTKYHHWGEELYVFTIFRDSHVICQALKNMRKNMKFWPLNPYYKRSVWKTWLSERFSEALTSKLWNKKNICFLKLQKWSQTELCSPSFGFIKKKFTASRIPLFDLTHWVLRENFRFLFYICLKFYSTDQGPNLETKIALQKSPCVARIIDCRRLKHF